MIFLSYLIVLFDTDDFIAGSAKLKISKKSSFQLAGNLVGEIYNQDKHGYGVEIKAISYHQLLVHERPSCTSKSNIGPLVKSKSIGLLITYG